MPFGEFLSIAGGSLAQVVLPVLFVLYFYRTGQSYSAALTLFWVGESTLNVSVYAADAVRQELPLLGGDGVTHDWNYLLDSLGLLGATPVIGGFIRLCGTLLILAAFYFALRESGEEEEGWG